MLSTIYLRKICLYAWIVCVCALPAQLQPSSAVSAAQVAVPPTPQGFNCGGLTALSVQYAEPQVDSSSAEYAQLAVVQTRNWTSDADFRTGAFNRTEVVSGSGRVTLERRWSPNVPINTISAT